MDHLDHLFAGKIYGEKEKGVGVLLFSVTLLSLAEVVEVVQVRGFAARLRSLLTNLTIVR